MTADAEHKPLLRGVRMRRLYCALAAGFACHVGAASIPVADELELAQLPLDDLLRIEVIGATRYAQPLSDTPASVTVIGAEELRTQAYRNIGEALSTVRGVYTSSDRNYTYLGVRGFNRSGDYNSRVVLLTDGARRNDALYDQAFIGNESPVEMDWVKRLEFVSGPSSAVYGGNALFGIVNLVMLDGSDVNGTRVSIDAGSGQSRRIGLVAGQALDGGGDWFVGFAAYGAEGEDHYYRDFGGGPYGGWARGIDGERYRKAYGKLRFGNWRLTGSFAVREKAMPGAPYGTVFGEPGNDILDRNGFVELSYDGMLGTGWQQHFSIFNGDYLYQGDYRYEGGIANRDEAVAHWRGLNYRLQGMAGAEHRWMLGTEAQWNTTLEQLNFDRKPYVEALRTNDPSSTFGVFVQDEWRFHPLWLLNLSLRHDKHSDYAAILSPRLALIYQPDEDLTLKAALVHSYRPPNAYERFYADGVAQKANPALEPERMRSVEFAADFRLGRSGRAGVSVYRNVIYDMVGEQFDANDGLWAFANLPRVRAHGIELDAEQVWSGGYSLRGSVAWQRSQMNDGSTLENSPRLLGKLVFSMPVDTRWKLAGQWQGMTSRQSKADRVAGHGLLNVVLSTLPSVGCGEWSLGVYNLTDQRYADPASSSFVQDRIEQDRRQFRVRWQVAL
ncbi:TonB-dependent receptor [Azoarcus sp. L1K30]|uniref:TonB-dependent receptor plug domain-containing protein n=1 Tax=Azoarcus sp. L1K30 TaxID=2820277 RepID=UPI001B826185|nr:TonB-dependent receptor [Azoarcus sp. L1K30]MBR0567150.1 TonB-dependent receptor [Azoarcus sp. L1K30]